MSKPLVSVIIPMHNEVENAASTLAALGEAMQAEGWTYELIPVDDGSTDSTADSLEAAAAEDERIRPITYAANRGRGYAMRRGFAVFRGEIVVTMDADLSYTADHAARMVRILLEDPEAHLVLASPYMPGGRVEGVPFMRLLFSRAGNWVLQRALPTPIHTSTGIVRAYRAEVIRSLDLTSDGKEIHLEILSEALALSYRIIEMPAVLRTRRKGTSKFRPKATVLSHLVFSLMERPAALFAAIGVLLLVVAMVLAAFLLSVFLQGALNPERPLMTVMVLLFLGGAVGLSFAIMSMQMLELRRSIVRLQAEVLRMRTPVPEDREDR